MTSKLNLTKPTFFMLYGFPGSGKSAFARQLCDHINAAHIQGDRIRYELFEDPRYDRQENEIVAHLMDYMTEEFMRAGISVVYDINASRQSERHALRDMARKSKAQPVLIWFQIDQESAFQRVSKRDRRKTDDKYSSPLNRSVFDEQVRHMQNPSPTEAYIVVSGKHNYATQKNTVVKKLFDMGLLDGQSSSANVVKPGLVNLIPNPAAGRVDTSRRNIIIR